MDQLPRLGKRELNCLLLFTCNYVVSVWRGFLFLWVLGMGYVILLWHSLSLPYNYFSYEITFYPLFIQLLHRATPSQKDFLKQELDFDEINENPVSELPLGTRVEPKSKRALLQASLQRPGSEASARFKAAEETFGTVVNHTPEDEGLSA